MGAILVSFMHPLLVLLINQTGRVSIRLFVKRDYNFHVLIYSFIYKEIHRVAKIHPLV